MVLHDEMTLYISIMGIDHVNNLLLVFFNLPLDAAGSLFSLFFLSKRFD